MNIKNDYDLDIGIRDAQIIYNSLKLSKVLLESRGKNGDLTEFEWIDFRDTCTVLQHLSEICVFENNKIIGFSE